jgi:hypothetical protein
MEENKSMMVQSQNQVAPINFFGGVDIFKEGWNMAGVLAESDLVPQHFRGKKANCLIALNMAQRMQADPLMVMQNLVVVHGTPTFEAKFAIACFNATGKYSPIRYREVGERGKDSWGYIAYAIEKSTGDVCEGPEVTIAIAKAEGWVKNNPKWTNAPELMLRYRSASWFIRTTDPGVIMGFQTKEELEDFAEYEEVPADNADPVPNDANAETLDMPKEEAKTAPEPKPQDEPSKPAPKKEETTVAAANGGKPENEKPLGKQTTPDIFGNK